MSSEGLKAVQDSGVSFEPNVEHAIQNREIVCFIKYLDKEFRGIRRRKFIVVRLFESSEVSPNQDAVLAGVEGNGATAMNVLSSGNNIDGLSAGLASGSDSTIEWASGISAERQFFSPRTKIIVDEMLKEKNKEKVTDDPGSGVKRSLEFADQPATMNDNSATSTGPVDLTTRDFLDKTTTASESPGKKNMNMNKLKQS